MIRVGRRGSPAFKSGGVRRDDGDDAAAAAFAEVDRARGAGVDRVVLADPDAVARLEAGPALTHDDLAAGDGLAGEDLHAEALRVRVAAVAAGAEALLVCHEVAYPLPIEVIRMRVSSWRWPVRRLYPRLGLNLKTRSFGPRSCATISACTEADASPSPSKSGASPSPASRSGCSSTVAPTSSGRRSMRSVWPSMTRYCLPPVLMTP